MWHIVAYEVMKMLALNRFAAPIEFKPKQPFKGIFVDPGSLSGTEKIVT